MKTKSSFVLSMVAILTSLVYFSPGALADGDSNIDLAKQTLGSELADYYKVMRLFGDYPLPPDVAGSLTNWNIRISEHRATLAAFDGHDISEEAGGESALLEVLQEIKASRILAAEAGILPSDSNSPSDRSDSRFTAGVRRLMPYYKDAVRALPVETEPSGTTTIEKLKTVFSELLDRLARRHSESFTYTEGAEKLRDIADQLAAADINPEVQKDLIYDAMITYLASDRKPFPARMNDGALATTRWRPLVDLSLFGASIATVAGTGYYSWAGQDPAAFIYGTEAVLLALLARILVPRVVDGVRNQRAVTALRSIFAGILDHKTLGAYLCNMALARM